ncbi:sigma-70 family RNA polymerase sigma factor [Paenarthrobacter aurescens]|uniref:RNA polymerase sigma (70) factor n=1 Tax=Paenarthrobacter aurescens (strain TC1) TaxID=290340 RepID=A1R1H1_PAEAT|nr:sigma-70 family RNA polymerase sigma factor [Paenarthrobacter aurescens]ABM08205.1 putative RNA polymerase sigma (70) factor [Paenarthrobacter aurescens TC1]
MDQLTAAAASGESPASTMAARSDSQIIELVREGATDAFDVLYQRHFKVAHFVARAQSDNPSDADDVVAESFAAIFQQLTEGKGPKEFFRSYLLTVVRRTAHDRNRKARRMPTAADDAILDSAVLDSDPVLDDLESSIMARAFKSLPERWQAVLWHLDIEGLKPAAAAPLVGLTPNGVSSLALRAREGLRQAYLQQHISQTVGDCNEYASQLGKYARNALKRTSEEKVRSHLDGCARCTALLMELNDVQGGMRAILFPLLTGIAFTPGAFAALGSAATAGGLQAAAGSTAVSGQAGAVAARTASQMWKLTAAIVVGVLALAGVLVWFLQPSADTESAVASDAASPAAPAAQETSSPSATPSSTPEPNPEPAATSTPEPTAVVIPPTPLPQRSAAVVDSGAVFSTPVPASVALAAPAAQTVDGTFSVIPGSDKTERDLHVGFSLQGEGAPSTGEAVFTLPDQATFVAGRTVAPAGWTCGNAASNMRQIRCTTESMDRENLAFTLGVALPPAAETGTVNYRFGGNGIVSKTFANSFR